MELRTLRYFVATVDAGSVNAASAVVHVTQPALSRQLRQLERELKVALFDRRSGRLHLTAAGHQFLPLARDLVHRADAAERAASAFAAGRLERVELAAPTTTLHDVIAPFLATLTADDPIPNVRELDPSEAFEALRQGADLAIVTERPQPDLAHRALATLPLWAYVRADHPWAGDDTVTLRRLAAEPLVVMTSAFKPRQLLDAALDDVGLAMGSFLETGNAQVAQALAASGRGAAVLTDDPRFDLHGLRIVGPHGPVQIRLHAAWEPTHHAADQLEQIAARLSAFCGDRYGDDVLP